MPRQDEALTEGIGADVRHSASFLGGQAPAFAACRHPAAASEVKEAWETGRSCLDTPGHLFGKGFLRRLFQHEPPPPAHFDIRFVEPG